MKTLQNSTNPTFASKIATLIVLLTLMIAPIAQPLQAAGNPQGITMQHKTSSSVHLDLGELMSGSQIITVENLIADQDGFSGTWWSVNPSEDMYEVIFTQTSGGNLPANTEIAIVTVSDPVNGFTHSFVLGTDGNVVVLVLGDF